MRKKYHSPELRREAVRQVIEYRQPVKDVAEQLHLGEDTVRVWVRRHREERTASSTNPAAGLGRAARMTEHELLKRMIERHLLKEAG
ncbi:transposase [Rhodanobacter lindaniclasticus]